MFRLAALPAPSDREKGQLFFQRYMQHFPSKGEVVIFDRSWYNRAGVEYVMGFCTEKQRDQFLQVCPLVENYMVNAGIQIIKIWLEVGDEEQRRRFEARIEEPRAPVGSSSPDGLAVAQQVVRVLPGARRDARCH